MEERTEVPTTLNKLAAFLDHLVGVTIRAALFGWPVVAHAQQREYPQELLGGGEHNLGIQFRSMDIVLQPYSQVPGLFRERF